MIDYLCKSLSLLGEVVNGKYSELTSTPSHRHESDQVYPSFWEWPWTNYGSKFLQRAWMTDANCWHLSHFFIGLERLSLGRAINILVSRSYRPKTIFSCDFHRSLCVLSIKYIGHSLCLGISIAWSHIFSHKGHYQGEYIELALFSTFWS